MQEAACLHSIYDCIWAYVTIAGMENVEGLAYAYFNNRDDRGFFVLTKIIINLFILIVCFELLIYTYN